jgi:predicted unusual protein kinase regulating ubiquinone biosynthesis (AarF/ABC1/UbiB family)
LLNKFDPKTDGADRNWVSIYEESERLLYLEIDYLNEATNAERFARDFCDVPWIRIPEVYREVSTPRVLTMEFVESFKLTELEKIDRLGLDRNLLAKRTADAFLRQIIETGYFHVSFTYTRNELQALKDSLLAYKLLISIFTLLMLYYIVRSPP